MSLLIKKPRLHLKTFNLSGTSTPHLIKAILTALNLQDTPKAEKNTTEQKISCQCLLLVFFWKTKTLFHSLFDFAYCHLASFREA